MRICSTSWVSSALNVLKRICETPRRLKPIFLSTFHIALPAAQIASHFPSAPRHDLGVPPGSFALGPQVLPYSANAFDEDTTVIELPERCRLSLVNAV